MKNKEEKGRSMVEMLGVLAIIGVLSAGGLVGYSKAMFRHKVNQTIDIFQNVLQRFAELEQKNVGNVGIGDTEDIIKYNLLDHCQEITGEWSASIEDEGCKLPVGILFMYWEDYTDGNRGEIAVSFSDSKSCIAFASTHWENTLPIEWFNPNGRIDLGSKTIYQPSENKKTVTMADITDGCKKCDDDGWCDFYLVIRSEL